VFHEVLSISQNSVTSTYRSGGKKRKKKNPCEAELAVRRRKRDCFFLESPLLEPERRGVAGGGCRRRFSAFVLSEQGEELQGEEGASAASIAIKNPQTVEKDAS